MIAVKRCNAKVVCESISNCANASQVRENRGTEKSETIRQVALVRKAQSPTMAIRSKNLIGALASGK